MNKQDLKELFALDNELIETYHICSGKGLDVCVDDTWKIIKDIDLYQTDYGYFGIQKGDLVPSLTGFFIKPEMRNKETVVRFWQDVESKFDKKQPFCAGVYKKNVPAVRFLSRAGKILSETDTEIMFYFLKEN